MYHYAYVSNLCSSYLRQYCPSATFVMKADLPNFRVEFRHYSEVSGGGISTIGPYAPARSYLDKMIVGTREHGLDAEYMERLVALRQSLDEEAEQ